VLRNDSDKTVSILGCGWIGKALKEALYKEKVNCLSRDIQENEAKGFYLCDTFVIGIAPRENHLEVIQESLSKLKTTTQVIFLSSISFYNGKKLVIQAEELLQKLCKNAVILRLGGLMGYNRIAGKYTAGKLLPYNSRTNYVHRDDVVAIIQKVIALDVQKNIFDIVAPQQTTKKKIFLQNAKQFDFEKTNFLPHFQETKILTPDKICKECAYTFLQKDVEKFW